MKILCRELLAALDLTVVAAAKKGKIEQLSHFIFTGDEIVTFNNEMAIFFQFETPFTCSVKADMFRKQLSKFKSEYISIDMVKNRLHIRGDNEKASIGVSTQKDDEIFKLLHSIQNDHADSERHMLPDNFGTGVAFASFSASKKSDGGIFQCVHIEDRYIHSSDRYRATQFMMSNAIEHKLIIKRDVVNSFSDFSIRQYSVGDSWVSFYCDNGVTLSARMVFGEYPDLKPVFNSDGWGTAEFPAEIGDAIDFASVTLDGNDKMEKVGHISVDKAGYTVSAETSSRSSEKTILFDNSQIKTTMGFFINFDFLKTILKHTQKFSYDAVSKRVMFADENFKHVIRLAV